MVPNGGLQTTRSLSYGPSLSRAQLQVDRAQLKFSILTMSASPTGLSYIWSLPFNERDKRSSLFIFQRGPACNRLSFRFGGPGSAVPRRRPTHSSLSVFAPCFSSQRYQAQEPPLFSCLRRQSPISREIAPSSLDSLFTTSRTSRWCSSLSTPSSLSSVSPLSPALHPTPDPPRSKS